MKKLILFFFALAFAGAVHSQGVDEIIDSYRQAVGGKNWDGIKNMRLKTNLNQGGTTIPVEVVMMADGRTYTQITFNGNTMTMRAFDGQKSWGTNFMTMAAEEESAEESENSRRIAAEFPNALMHYKKLGYKASLIGTEKIDGTDCYKIKLEKKTMLVEGKEVPNIEYHYLDKESKVILMSESELPSGEMKGKLSQEKYSDYQEVNGVMVAFSNASGIKDGPSQTVQFEKVEMNVQVDENKFNFPKK